MATPDFDKIRLSDGERTHVLDSLSTHYVEGRIDLAEFDRRSTIVNEAVVMADLDAAFDDLPGGRPLLEGPDGRPQFANAQVVPVAVDAAAELTSLSRKGRVIDRVDGVVFSVVLLSFLLMQFVFHTPNAWLTWIAGLIISLIGRAIVDFNDEDEKAWEQLKETEEADRAERLKVALQRRRELDQ